MSVNVRGHNPIELTQFNGLWKRGDADSVPIDYFSDCNNIEFIQGGFKSRDGIAPAFPRAHIARMYAFTKQNGTSLISLDIFGRFWDSDYPTTPILTGSAATDFGFVAYAGRAYICPCDGNTGLINDFMYVYLGDGSLARKAAGAKPTDTDGLLAAAAGAAGHTEAGYHIFAAVYETNTGFLTAIGPTTLPALNCSGTTKVNLSAIPHSPNSYVVKTHIIATKAINPTFYTGNTTGYQFFFVPDAIVTSATTLTVDFYDSELLEDASYLLDMFEEIPAFAGMSTFHNRMIGWAEHENPSVIRVSVAGEVEAFNQVDGLLVFPLDGRPVTNAQEYRDVLYGFKITKTNGWTDNGDAPSTWPLTSLDQGLGAGLHSIAKVLDSEGVNIDHLIIGNYAGLYLFNGTYPSPELSWKIRDLWLTIDRQKFNKIQIRNDSTKQRLFMTLPDGTGLYADYSNGLDTKNIRFSPWSWILPFRTVAVINNDIMLGLGSI